MHVFRHPGSAEILDSGSEEKRPGYLPNAAIGWKQPNGFYYPPAFHSANLFFDKVDIRHYVIQPLFKPGTYLTDDTPRAGGIRSGISIEGKPV